MNRDEVETDWQNAKRKKSKANIHSLWLNKKKFILWQKKTLFLQDKVEANPGQTKDAY